MLPRKGNDAQSVERVFRMIDGLGYDEMILKSDQEPSIMAIKRDVKGRLRGTIKTEESPVGEHQSNGEVENGVQRVQGAIPCSQKWIRIKVWRETVRGSLRDTVASKACSSSHWEVSGRSRRKDSAQEA